MDQLFQALIIIAISAAATAQQNFSISDIPPLPEPSKIKSPPSLSRGKAERFCEQKGYACPQCEGGLQDEFTDLINKYLLEPQSTKGSWADVHTGQLKIKPGKTAEDFIADTTALMKRNNKMGNNRLNYIVVGKSESLHDTNNDNPRILLKSPESELWVSFNTNPKSSSYQKIEIVRFDGKKGRYLLQELDFSQGTTPPHADFSGGKCIGCHRDPPRPVWDTYRAWAGVLPPRDDMVESDDEDMGGKVDTMGRAYLRFLERIGSAKENAQGLDRRLANLDIPTNFKGTPREQIQKIKNQVEQTGAYRIPHYPQANKFFRKQNLGTRSSDFKTADLAGPAHLAFDQMLGQQMCQVTQQLKKAPLAFEKLKFAITAILHCLNPENVDPTETGKLFPPGFASYLDRWWMKPDSLKAPGSAYDPIPKDLKPFSSTPQMLDAVFKNTKKYNEATDREKVEMQKRYVKDYLIEVEHADAKDADFRSLVEAETRKYRQREKYHAAPDPGGVKSVGETNQGQVAAVRYLLEPFGYPVDTWSTARGPVVGDKSFAFADQFTAMFQKNRDFEAIWKSTEKLGNQDSRCKAIGKKSREALLGQFPYIFKDVQNAYPASTPQLKEKDGSSPSPPTSR